MSTYYRLERPLTVWHMHALSFLVSLCQVQGYAMQFFQCNMLLLLQNERMICLSEHGKPSRIGLSITTHRTLVENACFSSKGDIFFNWMKRTDSVTACAIVSSVAYVSKRWSTTWTYGVSISFLTLLREIWTSKRGVPSELPVPLSSRKPDPPFPSYFVSFIIVTGNYKCVKKSINWYLAHGVKQLVLHLISKPSCPIGTCSATCSLRGVNCSTIGIYEYRWPSSNDH